MTGPLSGIYIGDLRRYIEIAWRKCQAHVSCVGESSECGAIRSFSYFDYFFVVECQSTFYGMLSNACQHVF
jgi:hypothetical protein